MVSRKFTAIISLLLFLSVLLAACGDTPTNTAVATTAAPVATTAATSATTAASAATTAANAATTAAGAGSGSMAMDAGSCTTANASTAAASGKVRLSIATGGTGGVYYPYGGGLAKLFSSKLTNTEATAEVTAASVDNMKLIKSEKADIAFTLADTAYDAFMGRGKDFENNKVPVCALAVLYTNYTHIVATESSNIKTVADLKGKKVSVGSAGSGTEIIANRVMEAAGLNPQTDITRDNLGAAESVSALKDNKLDAFFWSGGVPTGAITDLVNTPNVKVRFISNDTQADPLRSKYGPLYFKINLPKTGYKGLEADVPVVGVANMLVVNAKMSEQQAYNLLKAMFDNLTEVGGIHPEAKKLTLEAAVQGNSIAFHPGAIKFFKEKGAMK